MASFIFEEAFSSLFPILDHVRIPSWYLMFQILLALGRPWLPICVQMMWLSRRGSDTDFIWTSILIMIPHTTTIHETKTRVAYGMSMNEWHVIWAFLSQSINSLVSWWSFHQKHRDSIHGCVRVWPLPTTGTTTMTSTTTTATKTAGPSSSE